MNNRPVNEPGPAERIQDTPRILRALQQAVREAIESHRRAGNAIAVWRNGRVAWIPPEEIPAHARTPDVGE